MSEIEEIKMNWESFAQTCKGLGERSNLDALLRSACKPVAIEGNILVLGFYYEFHKEKVEDPKYKILVQQKLQEFFKHSYQIKCLIIEPEKTANANTLEEINSNWPSFLKTLKGLGDRGNIDALLRSTCEPLAIEGDTLLLGFYYEFHREKIEDPKYRVLVEKKLQEYFKLTLKIKCVIIEKKTEAEEPISEPQPEVQQIISEQESKHKSNVSKKDNKTSKITNLKHSKLMTDKSFRDGRVCLCERFMDSNGNVYEWVPKWKDVNELFMKASTIEDFNEPGSTWLKEFAKTSKQVFDKVTGIKDAFVIKGYFSYVRDGKLILKEQTTVENYDQESDDYVLNLKPGKVIGTFPVAFELTDKWLLEHIHQWLECIVINNVIVKVSMESQNSSETR